MSLTTSSKKRLITLKNVNVAAINHRYGLMFVSNLESESTAMKITKISDIIASEQDHVVTVLDETKKNYNVTVTMLEWVRQRSLPVQTDLHCFWCRHPFSTRPIGCPIRYVNPILEKSYVSHITKDKYYMKENVTVSKQRAVVEREAAITKIEPIANDYYLCDGVFCSFNCIAAFLGDRSHDFFYRDSSSLLHTLYYSFFGKSMGRLAPAPDWRLLDCYGGHLTIAAFRESFNHLDYIENGTLQSVEPKLATVGHSFRERPIAR